jgi:hypothetical protein
MPTSVIFSRKKFKTGQENITGFYQILNKCPKLGDEYNLNGNVHR